METKPILVQFSNRFIPRERIIGVWTETHKVFPYIKIQNPYTFKKEFPFVRRWLISKCWSWKTLDCMVIELDNGKVLKKIFQNGRYASCTHCEIAMGDFMRKYFNL